MSNTNQDGNEMRFVGFRLEHDYHRQLRILAAMDGVTVTDLLRDLVRKELTARMVGE